MKLKQMSVILFILAAASLVAALFGHAESDDYKLWTGVVGAVVLAGAGYWARRCS
jgi:phosphoglycerol transferase MdoB-like AlkP superfamily enzyme